MTLRNFSSTAAQTTLSAGVTAATTTLSVAATTGFPPAPFILAVDAGASAQELVLVTAVAGNNLTVTRGYDSTVAAAHNAGAVVEHSHAALDFREANVHVNATTGAHGATGAVVGTTDTQTLTNKTVALGSNTVSGTKAQFNAAMTDDDFATLTGAETLSNKTLSNPSFAALPAGVAVTNGANVNAAGTTSFLRGTVVVVNVSLTATAGLVAGNALFTLPVGHRPPVGAIFATLTNSNTEAPMRCHVDTTGVVSVQVAVTSGHVLRGTILLPL